MYPSRKCIISSLWKRSNIPSNITTSFQISRWGSFVYIVVLLSRVPLSKEYGISWKRCQMSSLSFNNRTSLNEMNDYLKTMALYSKMLSFCRCSTLSEIIWNSFGISGIILGSTLQNDGHNWLRRMHSSFISDKTCNISFRERAGLKNIYNRKGRLNLSNRNTTCVNKIVFYFDGT